MIKKVYAIRDAKSKTFDNPFPQLTHGEAERTFTSIVNSENIINKYPEDFDLYYLGEYETNTGKYLLLDTPQHQLKAVQVYRTKTQTQDQIPVGKMVENNDGSLSVTQ